MDELRILNNLKNIKEKDNVALTGNLFCDCECEQFYIYHTGKQTKGVLSPDIIKKNGKIVIIAKCTLCGEEIVIFDTSIDGIEVTEKSIEVLNQLKLKNNISKFRVTLSYNYFKQNFKSNYFLDIFIDVESDGLKSIRRIYE